MRDGVLQVSGGQTDRQTGVQVEKQTRRFWPQFKIESFFFLLFDLCVCVCCVLTCQPDNPTVWKGAEHVYSISTHSVSLFFSVPQHV